MKQCPTDHSTKKTEMGVQSLSKIKGLGRYLQTFSWDLQTEILWEQTEITIHKYIKVIHPSSNCLPEGGKKFSLEKKKDKVNHFKFTMSGIKSKITHAKKTKMTKNKEKEKIETHPRY